MFCYLLFGCCCALLFRTLAAPLVLPSLHSLSTAAHSTICCPCSCSSVCVVIIPVSVLVCITVMCLRFCCVAPCAPCLVSFSLSVPVLFLALCAGARTSLIHVSIALPAHAPPLGPGLLPPPPSCTPHNHGAIVRRFLHRALPVYQRPAPRPIISINLMYPILSKPKPNNQVLDRKAKAQGTRNVLNRLHPAVFALGLNLAKLHKQRQ